MKTEDRYLKFVRWSKEDSLYVGYCPDLFYGGVCHSKNEAKRTGFWSNWCARKSRTS